MLRAGFVGTGVTVQSASLAGYRRVLVWKMARRVGIAPTSAGFGGPCIACLPPPFLWVQPGTAGPHWKIYVLPSKGTESAIPPHTLPRVRPLFAALCALGWQIGP